MRQDLSMVLHLALALAPLLVVSDSTESTESTESTTSSCLDLRLYLDMYLGYSVSPEFQEDFHSYDDDARDACALEGGQKKIVSCDPEAWSTPSRNASLMDCGDEMCIDMIYACNGVKDCADGRDEKKCKDHVCPYGMFTCGFLKANGKPYKKPFALCIPDFWVCDDYEDCPGLEDQKDC